MSSGSAALPLGALVLVAVPVGMALLAGSAALLAVRGCVGLVQLGGAGVELAGRAADRLRERIEATAAEQSRAEVLDQLWSFAATEVLAVNRAIRILRSQAAAAGVDTSVIPAPLQLAGQSMAMIQSWLQRTEPQLAASRAVVEAAIARQEAAALAADLPTPVTPGRSAADVLAELQRAVNHEAAPAEDERAVDWSRQATIALRRLDRGALTSERQRALRLAAEVAAQTSEPRADLALRRLWEEIRKINDAVVSRSRACAYLEALEVELITAAATDVDPREPHLDTIRRLRAVADGTAHADDDLWQRAEKAIDFAREVALRERQLEAIGQCLERLGYSVRREGSALRLSRLEWQGQHHAEVWIPPDGLVHHEMYRNTFAREFNDESQRCRLLNGDVAKVCRQIAGEFPGLRVTADVPHTLDYRPGEPRVAEQATTGRGDLVRYLDPETGEEVTIDGA